MPSTVSPYKSNDNTFKITINNFPTEFVGIEGEPTVTDLVLYEEEIQFINEKYIPNSIATKKYVDDSIATANADTIDNLHIWTGTQAQYDALGTKDSNTIYLIKEG